MRNLSVLLLLMAGCGSTGGGGDSAEPTPVAIGRGCTATAACLPDVSVLPPALPHRTLNESVLGPVPEVSDMPRALPQCVLCPTALMVAGGAIEPKIDAAQLTREAGRPELEPAVAELVAAAEADVSRASSPAAAQAAVDRLLADLEALAQ